jgi:hypothetical protein
MAKLPDEIITRILNLQRQLLEQIDEVTETEFTLLEQFGEPEQTIQEFEQLQNVRERADTYYSRFYVTLRRVYESQPLASRDTLELLAKFISEAEATIAAIRATIQEIKRDFNLS